MNRDLPRWLTFGDPSRICERVEEMEQARAMRKKEKRGKGKFGIEDLKQLFEDSKKERQ